MSDYDTWRSMRQFVTIHGETLAYVRGGTMGKPPLVLIHGWLSHGRFWRHTMDALQQDYDLIAVDLYGFGFSDKHDKADYSIAAQARRVVALVNALGLDTFSVMGHSMGGAIALTVAAQEPERVQKVIDVAGVVTGKLTPYARLVINSAVRLGYYFAPTWWVSRVGFRRWRWYKYIYADNALTYEKDVIPLASEDLLMSVIPGNAAPTYHALNAINAVQLTEILKTIRVPCLIVFGREDNMVPVSEGYHAQQHIPAAELTLYERCGHDPMLEYFERFNADVKAFLSH